MSTYRQRRLARAVDNAINEYLKDTTFGWAGPLLMSGYSGEEGQKRAMAFQQALYIMTDRRILERCLEIFGESTSLKRHIVEHLTMCGLWYDKIVATMYDEPDKTAALTKVLQAEVETMKQTHRDYYNAFYLN